MKMKEISKGLLFIGLFALLSACGGGSKFEVALNENIETEYGEELDNAILFDAEKSEQDITVKEVKDFDNKKIGEQEIIVVFSLNEETQEEKVKVNVKDTKAPEITFKSDTVEITLGDSFDTVSNIESVKDVIDGDIAHSTDNTITADGYYFDGDIKAEVGEYTINVIAFDKNGNKSEKAFKVIIKEKEESENQVASNQGGTSKPQTPSQSGSSQANSGGNTGNTTAQKPSTPKVVCPNGNEPYDPNLPCDAWYSGGYDQCYRDSSGNIVVFSTDIAAADWADAQLSNPNMEENFQWKYGYHSFVTTPIGRNDRTHFHGVSFE